MKLVITMSKKIICFFLIIFSLIAFKAMATELNNQDGILIKNNTPNFNLVIPVGFENLPQEILANRQGYLYGFLEKGRRMEEFFDSLSIAVQGMGGVIGRNNKLEVSKKISLIKKSLPPDAQVSINKTHVLTFDVDLIVAYFSINEKPVISFSVQIPLKGEAIQLVFMGPPSRESELRDVMGKTLNSVEGESNWLSESERAEKLGRGLGMLLIGIIIFLIVILIIKKKRSK